MLKLLPEYGTPRKICSGVHAIAKNEIKRLVARPWNLYEPETTEWWLIPSGEWPAYRHGKYFFQWGDASRESVLAGLYIEKGLAPSISAAYPSAKGSRLIMQEDWKWMNLLRDLGSGLLPLKVKNIGKGLPSPVELRIDGGYVPDPGSFDPYSTRFGWDRLSFRWSADDDRFCLTGKNIAAHLLEELSQIATFSDLASKLNAVSSNAWLWIDFFIGIRCGIGRRSGDELVWSPSDLWLQFLRHFSFWIGSGG